MEVLNQLLEEELSQAVEVKDAKSLRRWVLILTSSFTQKQAGEDTKREFDARFSKIDSHFDKSIAVMEERFAAMDKRFDSAQWMIGIGMTLLASMMTLYQFLGT